MDTSATSTDIAEVRRFDSGAQLGVGGQDAEWFVFERCSADVSWTRVPKMAAFISSDQARSWINFLTTTR
jgi:hypothetical protein